MPTRRPQSGRGAVPAGAQRHAKSAAAGAVLLVGRLKTPELADLRRHFVEWLRRRGPSLDPQTHWREINGLQEANTMLEDRIREWKAQFRQEGLREGLEQGLERGLERGLEQGVEQGVAQGARTMLHRQLLRRFGNVPEPLAQRLAGATLPQLEAWADLVYEAETIEDVFH